MSALINAVMHGVMAFKKKLDSSCYPTKLYHSALISDALDLEKLATTF